MKAPAQAAATAQADPIVVWEPSNPLPPPSEAGSYVLRCWLARDTTIEVGALGSHTFTPGEYVYVGSARGPGGLQARLTRHINSRSRPKHWHIDYLLDQASIHGSYWLVSEADVECSWACQLRQLTACSIPGFGASDCRCGGHLFHLKGRAQWAQIQPALRTHVKRMAGRTDQEEG